MKILILFFLSFNLYAALAPDVQRMKDEMAMFDYIKEHKNIEKKIKYIDYRNFKIHLADGCIISFEREWHFRLPGWVGPAAPLVYDDTDCYDNSDEKPNIDLLNFRFPVVNFNDDNEKVTKLFPKHHLENSIKLIKDNINKNQIIRLVVYSSSNADPFKNKISGMERVSMVKDVFLKHGIKEEQIKTYSFSEEKKHLKNRVEIHVTLPKQNKE